ncbi:MAG: helix-turn-helix transcriptional regulator [Candidatus Aminicenantes bacterium]|nr:helix-turn-helix transcriptional regulator [Candidatus Aminicenantes bacterium]
MKLLSRAEEIVLLTVLKLKGSAYGVTIREHINKETGTTWSFGSIYMPLNKLARKEFVKKVSGAPTAERGGRSKCLYEVTETGMAALASIRRVQEKLWAHVAALLPEESD